jgi:putative membrane protein
MYDNFDGSVSNASGWFFMILMMVVVVVVIIFAARHLGGTGISHKNEEPFDILRRRYAKGEIDKKEYEEKRKDLKI